MAKRWQLECDFPDQDHAPGRRKAAMMPDGTDFHPRLDGEPTPTQMALARGHRWLAMLESGQVKNLTEIATLEGVDNSYVSRMVNLTSLAPDIVAAILDDTLPNYITLFDLADPPRCGSCNGNGAWLRLLQRDTDGVKLQCLISRSGLQHN